jgi:trans-aconitate methyltransferase
MNVGFKEHYFQELAALEASNFWFRARNKLLLWAMCRYAPQLQNFLEIGCGTGFVLSAVARQFPAAQLAGSEYLAEGLIYARQRVPNAELTQMDARHIPYQSHWDAIGAFDVLEHIAEDEQVLREIAKALKPGGMVFITVPQHRWLWSAVDEYACHVRRYEAAELHQKVRAAGFKILHSTSFVSVLLPAMYASRLLKGKQTEAKLDAMAELRIHPVLNSLFEGILAIERGMIRLGLPLPVGGSRLLIAQKLLTPRKP